MGNSLLPWLTMLNLKKSRSVLENLPVLYSDCYDNFYDSTSSTGAIPIVSAIYSKIYSDSYSYSLLLVFYIKKLKLAVLFLTSSLVSTIFFTPFSIYICKKLD